MPPKKRPRLCGGCSTTESISWHRQRGNNKFFCADCQERKLLLKNQPAAVSTTTNYGGEEGENSTMNSSESSVELGDNTTTESKATKMEIDGEKMVEGTSRMEGISIGDHVLDERSIGDRKSTGDQKLTAEEEKLAIGDQKSANRKSPNLSTADKSPIDKSAISGDQVHSTTAIDSQSGSVITQKSIDTPQLPADIGQITDRSSITGDPQPAIPTDIDQIDSKIDLSDQDQMDKKQESMGGRQLKKHQKSPISHPRLSRLRSSTSRPVRQAALAANNKVQSTSNSAGEKQQEKRSHSRSSSAAGGNFSSSKSTGGSSVSLSAISGAASQLIVPRNKGRRHIFKLLKPEKSSTRRATVSTHPSLWHKKQLYRQSDVVAVVDETDENIYYAMIRGLLRDEYCQQLAALTWLLPTNLAPTDRTFDPSTYVLGPEDESFYPLDSLEFICHLQNDYFKSRGAMTTSISTMISRSTDTTNTSLNPSHQFVGTG